MIREYLPFAGAVLTMLAGWMLAAWFAPSTPVLAALVFFTVTIVGFVKNGAGFLGLFWVSSAPLALRPVQYGFLRRRSRSTRARSCRAAARTASRPSPLRRAPVA